MTNEIHVMKQYIEPLHPSLFNIHHNFTDSIDSHSPPRNYSHMTPTIIYENKPPPSLLTYSQHTSNTIREHSYEMEEKVKDTDAISISMNITTNTIPYSANDVHSDNNSSSRNIATTPSQTVTIWTTAISTNNSTDIYPSSTSPTVLLIRLINQVTQYSITIQALAWIQNDYQAYTYAYETHIFPKTHEIDCNSYRH